MKKQAILMIISSLLFVSIPIGTTLSIDQANDTSVSSLSMSDQFSWRDHLGKDWMTPVKDQMLSGPCWAFAALSSLESVIKIRENNAEMNPDLSEQYILSCLPYSGSMQGGSSYLALRYMMETTSQGNNHNGAIPEWCFPYQETDEISCSEKDERWIEQLIPISAVGRWTSHDTTTDRQKIKDDVVSKGPIVTPIAITDDLRSWGYTHTSSTDYYPRQSGNHPTNHVVVILGWKDDTSISNGGYWICKNSWEPYWGYDGFFNIEYGALNIGKGEIVWVDYDPAFNIAPIATIKETVTGGVNTDITFDASKSFDADGDITEYSWDFGDGTSGIGKTVTHRYSERGIHTVQLTVTDELGKQGYDTNAALIDMWTKDDFWVYDIDEIIVRYDTLGLHAIADVSIPDLRLTVSDISSETYTIEMRGSVNGGVTVDLSGLQITASFSRSAQIYGTLFLDKNDLSIQDINAHLKGRVKMTIGDLPFAIPIPFDIKVEPIITGEISFIDLPLHLHKCWDNGGATVFIDGTISSPYLTLLYRINKIASLFGKGFLPSEYAQLLPDVDISDWFELEEIANQFEFLKHPRSFVCTALEEVIVPSGTFEAYKVVLEYQGVKDDLDVSMMYHYSPEVAMITDCSLDIGDDITVHAELVETSFM
ncbi:MAG: C1 family peptidase [Candidatus Thermoplasmatota archaeon]|nr:C1 family peptidase [Candidatus Thermoplasmatota archaeon]